MNYRIAPEVREVAEALILSVADLEHLSGANLEYVATDKAARKNGREIPGRATKVSGVASLLANPEHPEDWRTYVPDVLVVEVSEVYWHMMKAEERRGLVDHLLSHFVFDSEKGSWSSEPPEYGEFEGTLGRHGFWRPMKGMRKFAACVSEQLSLLPDDVPDEDDRAEEAPDGSPDENLFASAGAVGSPAPGDNA